MSITIGDAIDIKPRVIGDEVTCIEVNELWDMCAILCEILAHYDPSTGKLIANEFGDVQKMLSKIVKGEGLSRLYKNFRVDEETDKIKYRYKTAAGRLGKYMEKPSVIIEKKENALRKWKDEADAWIKEWENKTANLI